MTGLELSTFSLISFVMTCLVIELTPGPNMGYLAVLSATSGRRAGLAVVAGVALGLLVVGIAAALGLAAVIAASPALYQMLRWAGIAYFLWLAWDAWRDVEMEIPDLSDVRAEDTRYFVRGFVTNVLNPKAMVFYVAVLPSFVHPTGAIAAQTLGLSLLFVAIATALHTGIVMLAATTQRFLRNDMRRIFLTRALAVMLVGIAAWFALSTGQSPGQ